MARKKNRLVIYTILEDLNYDWSIREIKLFLTLWIQGWSLKYICQELSRDPDEVVVMMMDLDVNTNLLRKRPYGHKVQSPIRVKKSKFEKELQEFSQKHKNGFTAFLGCEKVDFIWDERQFNYFEDLWNKGFPIQYIAKALKRKNLEIALLVLDRRRKGKIGLRRGGLFGWRNDEGEVMNHRAS